MFAAAEAPRDTPVEAIMTNALGSTANSIAQSLHVNSDQLLRMGLQEKLGRRSKLLTATTAACFAPQNSSLIRSGPAKPAVIRQTMHQAKLKAKASKKSTPPPEAQPPLVGFSGARENRFYGNGLGRKNENAKARQL
jgi:hypothetical protein